MLSFHQDGDISSSSSSSSNSSSSSGANSNSDDTENGEEGTDRNSRPRRCTAKYGLGLHCKLLNTNDVRNFEHREGEGNGSEVLDDTDDDGATVGSGDDISEDE